MKNIDTSGWVKFRVGHLFRVFNGKKYVMKDRLPGDIPLVSTSALNNGISDHVSFPPGSNYRTHSDVITVAYSGSVGATFYHPDEVFVGETVMGLELLDKTVSLSDGCGLFIAAVIEKIVKQFNYVNKVKVLQMKNEISIPLPVTAQGTPDWDFMEQTMRSIVGNQESKLRLINELANSKPVSVDVDAWREFKIGDLFDSIKRAKRRTINSYEPGDTPYVTNSAFNNGVSGYLMPKSEKDIERGQCISVNTVDGSAFWQEEDFLANSSGNGLLLLRREDLNPLRALFLCTTIKRSLDPSFTVMLTLDVVKESRVKLPVDASGAPDWEYMESTMKKLLEKKTADLDVLEQLLPLSEVQEVVV